MLCLHPAVMVKGAEFAVAPVLSGREKTREAPDAMLVDQVYEVPVCMPRFSRGAAAGLLPGMMLRNRSVMQLVSASGRPHL